MMMALATELLKANTDAVARPPISGIVSPSRRQADVGEQLDDEQHATEDIGIVIEEDDAGASVTRARNLPGTDPAANPAAAAGPGGSASR
ncbi:MAG: hypothetical protein Ct9H300mP1_05150 [Planctomycetaceae bacterium]|nr:MAG: hypothetical protein Ct9H300mP1_05150 [Planctomycetaceae bacterium]